MKWWDQMPWSSFLECWVLSQLFHSPLPLSSKGLFSSSSSSATRVVSSAYLRLLIFLSASILIPACASSSPAFQMMCSAYKLNNQGDSIQPWHSPLLIWNQSVVPCPVLTVASWPVYRFLRRQEMWSGIPVSFRIFHSLLWTTQSKALAESIKQKQMFFWNALAFSMIQQMLAVWSLVSLPFLNPAWTSGSSQFMYCWRHIWRILSIILLVCSVQFSHSVISNSLWPHELQHARPPCLSPTPGVYPKPVHRVGDAIQPSHPLSSPSPPALNLSQRQGLFKWVSSLHQVAKVLEFQL